MSNHRGEDDDEQQDQIPNIVQDQRTNRQAQANDGIKRVVEQFKKLHPPSFDGTSTDSIVVEEWIEEIEKAFDFMDCNDRHKVACASYMLKRGANKWWNLTRRTWNVPNNPLSWERFKELFFEKFFLTTVRQDKEVEFIKLP